MYVSWERGRREKEHEKVRGIPLFMKRKLKTSPIFLSQFFKYCVFGIPKITPCLQSTNLIEGLTQFNICLYSGYAIPPCKDTKKSQKKEKVHGQSWEESRLKLLRTLTVEYFNSFSNELWQHMQSVVYWGSSWVTSCSRLSLRAVEIGTLCLPHPKFKTPRGKADVQHKPYCLHSLAIVSHLCHLGKFYIGVGHCLSAKFSDAKGQSCK